MELNQLLRTVRVGSTVTGVSRVEEPRVDESRTVMKYGSQNNQRSGSKKSQVSSWFDRQSPVVENGEPVA